MVPLPHFDYIKPESLKKAVHVLSEGEKQGKVLAGGTDLLVQMKKRLLSPKLLVDIKGIRQLSRISLSSKGELVLGARVTLGELDQWAKTRKEWLGLSIAASSIGSEQVRNRGTVVGNVCRASPAGDMAPMLIALDGKAEIQGPKKKRLLLIENFIIGPGQTLLAPDEIVVSLRIPKPQDQTATAYLKLGARRAMDTAIVAVAVRISFDRTLKKIVAARIVLGAVALSPIRVPGAEDILMQQGVTPGTLEEISTLAMNHAQPITDLRGTEGYRSEMVRILTKRAVKQVWEQFSE